MFPHPYTHLTHRRILVESFHAGLPISDYLEHNDTALQRKLARIGIATVLKMVNIMINILSDFQLLLSICRIALKFSDYEKINIEFRTRFNHKVL